MGTAIITHAGTASLRLQRDFRWLTMARERAARNTAISGAALRFQRKSGIKPSKVFYVGKT